MKRSFRLTALSIPMAYAAILVGVGLPAAGANPMAQASLRLTGQVEGSMSVEFVGESVSGTVAHGRSSATFTIPFRMRAVEGRESSFMITSPFEIKVLKANLASTSYSLKAALAVSDTEHVWKIDGVDISAGSEQVVAGPEPYGTSQKHVLSVSGSDSQPAQSLARDVRFTVVAN